MFEDMYIVFQIASALTLACLAIVVICIVAGPMSERPLVERQMVWTVAVASIGGSLLRAAWVMRDPLGRDTVLQVGLIANIMIFAAGTLAIFFGATWLTGWYQKQHPAPKRKAPQGGPMKKIFAALIALVTTGSLCAQVPEWAIKATVKVSDWHGNYANGGTGTIVDYDKETRTCLVLTCRHVVGTNYGKIECTTWDGHKAPARFVGVHECSTRGADITVLEIPSEYCDTYVPIATRPIQTGDAICQVGWGGGRLNKRVGRFLGTDSYSGEGWRFHWNSLASFPAISGDSGSGIFSPDRKELVGVLWGGGGGTSVFCGPEYCRQAYELCLRKGRRRGNCPGGNCPGGVPTNPGGGGGAPPVPKFPEAPGNPPQTAPREEPKAAADLKLEISKVADSVGKLAETTGKIADGMGSINTRLISVEERLAAAEKARCQCSGAGSAGVPPPSASPPGRDYGPDIVKMQEDLARLRQTLKASGTLTIDISPKK